MQKKEITPSTSVQDVMPALARFIGGHEKEQFTEAPAVLQGMFEDLLDTDYGNSLERRRQMIVTLNMIRDLGSALEPFSQETIWQAVKF
jgi:hypothetical protein